MLELLSKRANEYLNKKNVYNTVTQDCTSSLIYVAAKIYFYLPRNVIPSIKSAIFISSSSSIYTRL